MKIIGITYGREDSKSGSQVLLLKGDSALLVNRKPFFVLDETKAPVAYPALALRICRLGKTVSPRYADRYYDAVAPALDIQAADLLEEAKAQGAPWTQAVSLDGSLPLGEWNEGVKVTGSFLTAFGRSAEPCPGLQVTGYGATESRTYGTTEERIAEAVSLVSKWMTIRQGDVIYVQLTNEPIALKQNDLLTARMEGDETDRLFCRIK
jgi:2-keto-4-pentenoate hydratase/2-oxohepta-3-ene-1,7-dioic acid hydratase in catechol pathway